MQLEIELSSVFKVPLQVNIAVCSLSLEAFSEQERLLCSSIPTQQQKDNWLLGRTALKRLLASKNQALPDTSRLIFPNRELSLSHKSNMAIAVRRIDNQPDGIGVDVEEIHHFKPEWAQFFLTPFERNLLREKPPNKQSEILCAYWSVKEAVYKADLGNKAFDLIDYEINDFLSGIGIVTNLRSKRQFHYYCRNLQTQELADSKINTGILSFAIPLKNGESAAY